MTSDGEWTRVYVQPGHHAVAVRADQRLLLWAEVEETTAPGSACRTYARTGVRHARVLVPVPWWAAGVLWRLRRVRRRLTGQ